MQIPCFLEITHKQQHVVQYRYTQPGRSSQPERRLSRCRFPDNNSKCLTYARVSGFWHCTEARNRVQSVMKKDISRALQRQHCTGRIQAAPGPQPRPMMTALPGHGGPIQAMMMTPPPCLTLGLALRLRPIRHQPLLQVTADCPSTALNC